MSLNDTPDHAADDSTEPRGSVDSAAHEPMTPALMARLFIVPALIVCVLLAVAVVVVLFGTTTADKPETIADLLKKLDADTGERTLGHMLDPKAKESWQAAQELARRLEKRDKFISPEEIDPTAKRLIEILGKYPPGRNVDEPGPSQKYFTMIALARLHTPLAVEPLTAKLKDENWWTRSTALQALAELKDVPEARKSLPAVLPLLKDPVPAVQIVACATVACLAEAGDSVATRALSDRLEAEAEVQWNAAMALARLGSATGKLTLLNMLNRGYWEGMDLQYLENGASVRRKYTEAEVSRNLKAAIEAAACVHDTELRDAIASLGKDPSVVVREAARAALEQGGGSGASRDAARTGGSSMSSTRLMAAGESS
ncbi:MAG: hypothetical protein DCC65_00495 [Planctomycetota bacterium]|nr:MAG: hypothetical protein DCC65_00495 [Planctomycetota bacterium]